MNAAAQLAPSLSELLPWAEICERFPDQWVTLINVEWDESDGIGVRAARVVGHGTAPGEACRQSEGVDEMWLRWTGRSKKALRFPRIVLDDETRDLLRDRR